MIENRTARSPAASAAGDALGLRLGQALKSTVHDSLSPDISERLRFARQRAVDRARQVRLQAERSPALGLVATPAGTLAWVGHPGGQDGPDLGLQPGGGVNWRRKLAALLPLAVLALGLLVVQQHLSDGQIEAAAEVDAALLSDDLPPQAYSDPGFREFLRRGQP